MATKCLIRPRDPIQLGKLIVDIATGQIEDRVEDTQAKNAGAQRFIEDGIMDAIGKQLINRRKRSR
jgi:hypothetical protein